MTQLQLLLNLVGPMWQYVVIKYGSFESKAYFVSYDNDYYVFLFCN